VPRLDELAEGIADLLVLFKVPEPLSIDLRGEGPDDALILVRAIIDSCSRRGLTLQKILIVTPLGSDLFRQHGNPGSYGGVLISSKASPGHDLEIFRGEQGSVPSQ